MRKNYSIFFAILILVFFTESAFTQNIPIKITPVGIGDNSNTKTVVSSNSNIDATNFTVMPGNGSTSGNGRAPQGTRRFINTKYLILGSEMTASGFGSNAVTSIGWRYNVPGFGTPTAQTSATTGRLIVYLRDTSGTATTIGSTFIDTNGVGYTKIIEGTINIPATSSEINIDIPVGGPGTSSFIPTPGNGVMVIFVYTTLDVTLPTGNPVVYCTNSPGGTTLLTYQSQTVNGTTGTSSAFRPETRFGNALNDIVQVTQTYTLGKVPRPFGVPYNISTLVKNVSASPVTFNVDISILDSATGTVRYSNTATVTGLAANTSQEVFFNDFTPSISENDSIIVTVANQPGEDITSNNRSAKIVRINSNTYGYGQKFTPDGGVGFTGATGDFVARFRTNSSNSVNQIDVNFSTGGQNFQVGIWDATGTGGTPGTNLYTSSTQLSTAGVFTILVNPPVAVNGDFFVGVRQIGTTNVSFAYQTETPIRDSTFYYTSPTGGTTWTDFAPANAFRFMIEPKFALNNDVGATAINQSGTTYLPMGTTNIAMTGVVTNFGLSTNSFDVNRKIYDNTNALVYNNTVSVSSLAANGTASTTFPDFTGFTQGVTYTIIDSTLLGTDQNNANDKISRTFTPFVAGLNAILYTDAASRDSLVNQMTGYSSSYNLIDGATYTGSFRNFRTIYYLLASSGNWTTAVRDSLKAALDNSSPSSKITLVIFGNDLGYNNDPIRNASATAADTTFYRQYLRAQYIADSWISAVAGSGSKMYGTPGSPFASVSAGDSCVDAFPDMVRPASWYGGASGFIPVSTTTGDSSCIVYYLGANYNVLYGTNTYASFRTRATTDNPINIFNAITDWINSNGGVTPVELASFTATTVRNEVNLNWRTVSELNNSGFEVERSVNGTNNWMKIGFVNGNGTTNSEKSYTFKDAGLAKGAYTYRLKQVDYNGNFEYYRLSGFVNVGVPNKFEISQNYPNPFNPATKISYDLPFDSKVAIKIFDVTGREVASLVNQVQVAGYYTVNFNASALSSGVYFYQINADGGNQNFTKTLKMMLIK
ncbi:MAG: T9SS type A sorting domain-containing protein [Bacteroidetes bacterium]|nr:T9SS type A sorting domain-containing protein [Bacteroidota bacterium]